MSCQTVGHIFLFVTLIWIFVDIQKVGLSHGQTTDDDVSDEQENIDTEFLQAVFGGLGPVMNPPDVKDESEINSLPSDKTPEQIHISYGGQPSEMIVMWSTAVPASSVVWYGLAPDNYTLKSTGEYVHFTLGNPDGLQYVHRVLLTGLIPGRNYSYKVESDDKHSDGFVMTTMIEGEDWSPLLLVYGDMGRRGGAPCLKLLTEESLSGNVDAIVHVGDFAYDMHDEGGKVGDDFMNRIQTMATRVPYMTVVGNHEIANYFSHYRYRFSMPNVAWPIPEDKMWYSFNMGKAHFISYSTEVYFTDGPIERQHQWLLQDLQEANEPANRAKRPWIIAMGHRPMYCSNTDNDDCTRRDSIVRASLEDLFFDQGVDVIIEAHEHSYERLWPVYKEKTFAEHYVNPRAPMHIISGAAGCNEFDGVCVNAIVGRRGDWSAFRAWLPGLYGFGRLNIVNATHIHWEQVVALNGQVLDSVWIEQNHHGPFEMSEEEEKELQKEILEKEEEETNWLSEWLGDNFNEDGDTVEI